MAADPIVLYDIFQETLTAEGHDLNAVDTIKVALLLNGYVPNSATDVDFAVIDANEHANANGYTTGGVTVACTIVVAAGVLTLDFADAEWTANGGNLVARTAVVYNSSAGGSDDLIGYILMDNTPADVTATDGNDLKVQPHADGVYTQEQTT